MKQHARKHVKQSSAMKLEWDGAKIKRYALTYENADVYSVLVRLDVEWS